MTEEINECGTFIRSSELAELDEFCIIRQQAIQLELCKIPWYQNGEVSARQKLLLAYQQVRDKIQKIDSETL